MLKLRLLSVVLLGPPVLTLIYFSDAVMFKVLSLVGLCVAGLEWSALSGLVTSFEKLCFLVCLIALTSLMYHANFLHVSTLLFLCWGMLFYALWQHPQQKSVWSERSVVAGMGLMVLSGFWYHLVYLKMYYKETLLLCAICLIWVADSLAYVVGRSCGKLKLAAHISPNKTWEGVFGAALACMIYAAMCAFYYELDFHETLTFLVLCFLCFILSVLGDLTISMLKRYRDMKDTGSLIPGHGGVLDRIDGLLPAMPCFAFGLTLLNYKSF